MTQPGTASQSLVQLQATLISNISGGSLLLSSQLINDAGFSNVLQLAMLQGGITVNCSSSGIVVNGNQLTVAGNTTLYGSAVPDFLLTITSDSSNNWVSVITGTLSNITLPGLAQYQLYNPAINTGNLPSGTFSSCSLIAASDNRGFVLQSTNTLPSFQLSSLIPVSLSNVGFTISVQNAGSSFLISGTTNVIGNTPLTIAVYLPVVNLSGNTDWKLMFSDATGSNLVNLADLISIVGGANLFRQLPPQLAAIGKFGLKSFTIVFNATSGNVSEVDLVFSTPSWNIVDSLTLKELDIAVFISNPLAPSSIQVLTIITANFLLGDNQQDTFTVSMTIPPGKADWLLGMSADISLGNISAFSKLPGGFSTSGLNLPASYSSGQVAVNYLNIVFNPVTKTLPDISFDIDITGTLSLFPSDPDVLSITELRTTLDIANPLNSNRSITGTLIGGITIAGISFDVSASKDDADSGWVFSIATQQGEVLDLVQMINQLLKPLNITLPGFVPDMQVSDISFTYNTQTGAYTVGGSAQWKLDLAPIPQTTVNATALMGYDENKVLSGSISGDINIGGVEFTIGYKFDGKSKDIYLLWNNILCDYNQTTKIITIKAGDTSLGEIISYLVNLIGRSNFSFSGAWGFLNDISLNGLEMTYDLTTKDISFTYAPPQAINLVFITINSFSINKISGKVTISIDGTFLGLPIDQNAGGAAGSLGSGQDVTSMPPVPGLGDEFFKLNYLGMGQHLTLVPPAGTTIDTVETATTLMKQAFQNSSGGGVPIIGNSNLVFNEGSSWIIGTQFTLLKSINLSIIFNDPTLYGLLIDIPSDSPKGGIFKGLNFEILYKKISDSIGQYHIDLQLPDAMRHLEFGAVSVTLPIVALDIYTNGNFKVDFGFPKSITDFSNSFTVQAFPFTGSGGFYFGVLNGQTATNIPPTTLGVFSPVIEFGIGLQLGLGKSISCGIMSAGISVTVVGIFQGTIGFFTPTSSLPDSRENKYYWLQGTFGLVGQIYGSINFAIISAQLNITVYAYITATIESYKPIPIFMQAGIDVRLTVSINLGLFSIHVHLSFSASVSENFTIGSDTSADAPWNKPPSAAAKLTAKPLYMNYSLRANTNDHVPLNWQPLLRGPLGKPPVTTDSMNLYFMPHLTVAAPPGATAAAMVAMLYIDTDTTASTGASDSSFNKLARAALIWAINAGVNAGVTGGTQLTDVLAKVVSLDQIQAIYDTIHDNRTASPIAVKDIFTFLQNYFVVNVNSPQKGAEIKASVFPMMPLFSLTGTWLQNPVDFSTYHSCDSSYQDVLARFFNDLFVNYENSAKPGPSQMKSAANMAAASSSSFSFATWVFQDYFVMLTQATLQDAVNFFKNYRYPYPSGKSTLDMVATINEPHLGIQNNVDVVSILSANKTVPLNQGTTVMAGGYTIQQKDTLQQVALQFGVTPLLLVNLNAYGQNIIAAGTVVSTYTVKTGDTFSTIAAALSLSMADFATLIAQMAVLAEKTIIHSASVSYLVKDSDTLAIIAGLYHNTSNATLGQVNAWVQGLIQTNTIVTVNGTSYTVTSKDSIQTIAQQLNATVPDVIAQLIAMEKTTPVLQPFTQVYIPLMQINTGTAPMALQDLANTYNTGISSLAWSNAAINSLFPDNTPVNIPGLTYLPVNAIADGLDANGSYANHSGMTARFMLHGLSLPSPEPGNKVDTLYNLLGQQIAVPATIAAGDKISLSTSGNTWITFNGAGSDAPLDAVLVQQDVDQVVSVRGTTLAPQLTNPVAPLPLFKEVAKRFAMKQPLTWQYGGQLSLPAGKNQTESNPYPLIWQFPNDMLYTLENPPVPTPQFDMEVMTSAGHNTAPVSSSLNMYGWGSFINISIKKLPKDNTGPACANTYQLVGADETGITVLERLLTYLSANPDTSIINQLHIMHAANANGSNVAGGYISQSINSYKASIVQSNLSTDTNPPMFRAMFKAMRSGPVMLPNIMNEPQQFLKLLWECSIVRSGGFYLYYNNNEGNTGLPDSLFASSDTATLSLFLAYQLPDTTLPDFVNACATGDHVDPNNDVVYANAANLLTAVPAVPPGNIGFTVGRTNPADRTDHPTASEVYIENQYNLLGYQVKAANGFNASNIAMPVGHGNDTSAPADNSSLDTDQPVWSYKGTIPIFRFAATNNTPSGGPDITRNPYLGIGQTAEVSLYWQDIFGNTIGSAPGQLSDLVTPVTYNDPVISISKWPGNKTAYDLSLVAGQPQLNIYLDFDPSRYTVSQSQSQEACINNAQVDILTYTSAFYQLVQPDLKISIACSLDNDTQHPVSTQPLITYLLTIYNYLQEVISKGSSTFTKGTTPLFSIPVNITNTAAIFELGVSVTLQRSDLSLVNPGLQQTDGYVSVSCTVSPDVQQTPAGTATPPDPAKLNPYTLKEFASTFETTFNSNVPANNYKIATGGSLSDIGSAKKIWVVNMGQGGISYSFGSDSHFFAPQPLYNSLFSRTGVPIFEYNTKETYPSGAGVLKTFSGIDMDMWAQNCLAAIEEFLSPGYAVPASILSPSLYQSILNHKSTIADAVSKSLIPILKKDKGMGDATTAQTKLKQQLLINLMNAYSVDTVVQQAVTVNAPASGGDPIAPNLYGQPVSSAATTGDASQQYSLSTAKIPVVKGESYLTYLLSVKDASRFNNLPLSLSFQLSNIEHEISTVPYAEGYQASSWLNFVIPVHFDVMGDVAIPVPLRSYPAPPSLIAQQCVPVESPATIQDVKTWSYEFTYKESIAAQDTINTQVVLNYSEPAERLMMLARTYDLFDYMAQFTSVYAAIKNDFDKYLLPVNAASPASPEASNALAAFEYLIGGMASVWSVWYPKPVQNQLMSALPESTLNYTVQESAYKAPGTPLDNALQVVITPDPAVPASFQPLEVAIDGYQTLPAPGVTNGFLFEHTDSSGIPDGTYLQYGSKEALSNRTLNLPGLDILLYQNAWAGVGVTRNEDLITGSDTNPAFVYQTPVVRAFNPLKPQITDATPWDIAALNSTKTDQPAVLAVHLQNMFTTLFSEIQNGSELIKLEVVYQYPVNQQYVNPSVSFGMIELPVLLVPPTPFNIPADSMPTGNTMAANLANAIKAWYNNLQPYSTGANIVFRVSVFDNSQTALPVLVLNDLYVALGQVTDI